MIYKKYENSGADDQTAPEFPYRKETHEKTRSTALHFYHSTQDGKMQGEILVKMILNVEKIGRKLCKMTNK